MSRKTVVVVALCLGMLSLSPAAKAQELKPYVGAGIGLFRLKYSDSTVSQRNTVLGEFGKLGVDVGSYVGAELRIGATGSGEKYYTGTITRRKLSDSYFFSYLLKLQYPADVGFNLYALVGGTTAKFKLATNAANRSASKTGLSYGVGLDYTVQDRLSAGIEWVQYWTNMKLPSTFGTSAKANISGAVAQIAYHF